MPLPRKLDEWLAVSLQKSTVNKTDDRNKLEASKPVIVECDVGGAEQIQNVFTPNFHLFDEPGS